MREKKLPIFKRGDYFYCYVRTAAGKREQRALHLRDDGSPKAKRAAVDAYWQEQTRATRGDDARQGRARKTLGKAIAALTAEQELAELSEDSLDNVLYRGRRLVEHFGVAYDLHDVTKEVMVTYAKEARKTRAASTVRMELGVLAQAMKAVGIVPPKTPKVVGARAKRQQPLTRQQVLEFFMALHPRQRLLGLTLITLGCRVSEVAKIPEDGIDWERCTLWIHGTKTAGSRRQVFIPDELYAFMKDLKDRGEWKGFPKQSRQAIDQIVRAAARKAFGEARSVNDLRGTWSTLAGLDGVSAELRAAFQGNSPEQQRATYSQPTLMPDDMRAAVAKGIPRIKSGRIGLASENTDHKADSAAVGGTIAPKPLKFLRPPTE